MVNRHNTTKYALILISGLLLAACGHGDLAEDTGKNSSLQSGVTYVTSTVSWVAPTTRANGDPLQLSEIGGYRIYYGSASDSLDQVIEISDPSVTEYVVNQLVPSDTYYFAVTAYDTEGIESALSEVVSKVVG